MRFFSSSVQYRPTADRVYFGPGRILNITVYNCATVGSFRDFCCFLLYVIFLHSLAAKLLMPKNK